MKYYHKEELVPFVLGFGWKQPMTTFEKNK